MVRKQSGRLSGQSGRSGQQGQRQAFKASEKALRAVNKFIEDIDTVYREQALSDLYDAVGRIIMVNQSIKDRESLQGVIM